MAQKITLRQIEAILDSLGMPDGCGGTGCGRCACGNEEVYEAIRSIYLTMQGTGQQYVYVYGRDAS